MASTLRIAVRPPRAVRRLQAAAAPLLRSNPRLGSRLSQFSPREARRLFVDNYELHYEIRDDMILIANLRHTSETR